MRPKLWVTFLKKARHTRKAISNLRQSAINSFSLIFREAGARMLASVSQFHQNLSEHLHFIWKYFHVFSKYHWMIAMNVSKKSQIEEFYAFVDCLSAILSFKNTLENSLNIILIWSKHLKMKKKIGGLSKRLKSQLRK